MEANNMASLGDLIWIAALGGLFYYMMRRGGGCCGGQGHDHEEHDRGEHKEHSGKNDHVAQSQQNTEIISSDNPAEQDPVCGMQVNKIASAPASEHFGRTFHFCSEQCRKLFNINPGKYAGTA
jgi:YHS domain-containing protein